MGLVHQTGWRAAQMLAARLPVYHVQRLALLFAERARPHRERQAYACPLCGHEGMFEPIFAAKAMRFDGECPKCFSRERHRFLKVWLDGNARAQDFGDMLHFAPEPVLKSELQGRCRSYRTADIMPGRADLVLNIEAIDLPDASLDTVVANHVLEHVDDTRALREILRVLRPGGFALLTMPVVSSWSTSYEAPEILCEDRRFRHFGQEDHVRMFGNDIAERIRAAGFTLETVVADGAASARFGLIPGDTLYLATRPKS